MTQALRQKEHVERVKLSQVSPELYEAMQVLSSAAAKGIEPDPAELIKIRASQMNRCVGHVSDEVYSHAAAVFSDRELGQVIGIALTINAWNRISITTRLKPPHQ